MSVSSFDPVRSIVVAKIGHDSYIDQVNLCLMLVRKFGINALMDHISISLDYLFIEDKIVWAEGIMQAHYSGVISIE